MPSHCSLRPINASGDDAHLFNGIKLWTSGAMDPRCKILMGKTDPDGPAHRQQSLVLVPTNTLGVRIFGSLPVFCRQDQHSHAWIGFENIRVPATNILATEGDGFMVE